MLLENTTVSEASVTQASRLVSEALVTLLDKTVYCKKKLANVCRHSLGDTGNKEIYGAAVVGCSL